MTGWKAIANAITHREYAGLSFTTIMKCERCYSPHLFIISFVQESPKNYHEDLIIVRRYVYQCMECDAIEADLSITVIPSWIWHPLREKELEEFDGCLIKFMEEELIEKRCETCGTPLEDCPDENERSDSTIPMRRWNRNHEERLKNGCEKWTLLEGLNGDESRRSSRIP